MNATTVLQLAQDAGIELRADGLELVLNARAAPSDMLLNLLREHKSGIIRLLSPASPIWDTTDWRLYFDERAAVAQFDGGLSASEAGATAYECSVVQWLDQQHQSTNPSQCAHCGAPKIGGLSLLPFGAAGAGHVWLHQECWRGWCQSRRQSAMAALSAVGIQPPVSD